MAKLSKGKGGKGGILANFRPQGGGYSDNTPLWPSVILKHSVLETKQ